MFRSRVVRGVAALVTIGGVTALAWWLFPSDVRRVRARFDTLAKLASVPAEEQDLARLARARNFGAMLATDVSVSFEDGTRALDGRDALMLLVAQPAGITGGIHVDLRDVSVDVAASGTEATSTGRARAAFTDPHTRQPSGDERDLTLLWRKIDGDWLVSSVRVGAARAGRADAPGQPPLAAPASCA
jgi:hypothetical protein